MQSEIKNFAKKYYQMGLIFSQLHVHHFIPKISFCVNNSGDGEKDYFWVIGNT